MRKTLAIVLSVLMVVSLLCLGVSAAEGTPVKTAEEFAAMTADGTYYLDADLKIDVSYADVFKGVLDGNGHTVTLSVPMFSKFAGTAKNLKLKGEIVSTAAAADKVTLGAIAGEAPKESTVVLENIVTDVTLKGAYRTGALIGQVSDKSTLTVTGCTNNGSVTAANMVGGFVGYMQGYTALFTGCVNNGDVSVDIAVGTGLAGGIIGRFGGDNVMNADNPRRIDIVNCLNTGKMSGTTQAAGIIAHARGCSLNIANCTNQGEINSVYSDAATNKGSSDAAGIFGSTASSDGYYCLVTIDKCVNEGSVTSANARAGGIAGYVWCGNNSGIYCHAELTDCVNYGTVAGGSFVAQMLAYTNDALDVSAEAGKKQPTKIQGVGLGNCVRSEQSARGAEPDADGKNGVYFALIGISSSTFSLNLDYNLTLLETTRLDWVCYSEGTPANRHAISEKPDTVKLVSLDACKDAVKALGTVGYVAPAAPEQPEVPEVPTTGDALFYVAVVAAVSVLGMAVAIRKKED